MQNYASGVAVGIVNMSLYLNPLLRNSLFIVFTFSIMVFCSVCQAFKIYAKLVFNLNCTSNDFSVSCLHILIAILIYIAT